MFGDANGNFRPQDPLTRAEAATLMARVTLLDFKHDIIHLPPGMVTFDVFDDVMQGQWFYHYVAWAYHAGLVQGHGGSFRPNDPITREEFAALLVRAKAMGLPADMYDCNILLADAKAVSPWARAYVSIAYSNALIIGDPSGNFRPQDSITRAEAATVVNRLLGRIDGTTAMQAVSIENLIHVRQFPDVSLENWYYASVIAATNSHYLTRADNGSVNWMLIC